VPKKRKGPKGREGPKRPERPTHGPRSRLHAAAPFSFSFSLVFFFVVIARRVEVGFPVTPPLSWL
jgi:hypothetical protein